MEFDIRLFGIARDIAGASKLVIDFPADYTIKEVKAFLESKYPKLNDLKSMAFAVNESYVDDSYTIQPNDELVVIPPVSGG